MFKGTISTWVCIHIGLCHNAGIYQDGGGSQGTPAPMVSVLYLSNRLLLATVIVQIVLCLWSTVYCAVLAVALTLTLTLTLN